jgi:hypothetical protein
MMIVCATSQFCMSEHIYPNSRDSIPLVLESKKVNLVTVNVSNSLCSETLVDGLGVVVWLSLFMRKDVSNVLEQVKFSPVYQFLPCKTHPLTTAARNNINAIYNRPVAQMLRQEEYPATRFRGSVNFRHVIELSRKSHFLPNS